MQFKACLEGFRGDDVNGSDLYRGQQSSVAIHLVVRCTRMDGFMVRCATMDGFLMPNVSNSPINNTLYGCKNWWLATANPHRIQPDSPKRDAPKRDAPEENLRHSLTLGAGQVEH